MSGWVVRFASTAAARAIGMFAPTWTVRSPGRMSRASRIANSSLREAESGIGAQISSDTSRRTPISSR